jgi:arachidonate 15-lipoxygenase
MTDTSSSFSGSYVYDYDALPPLAMQKGVPLGEIPSLEWFRKVLGVAFTLVGNELFSAADSATLMNTSAEVDKKEMLAEIAAEHASPSTDEFVDLIRSIWDRLNAATPSQRPQSLHDYAALFRTIPLPSSANVLFEDDAFAWWRVAGPNPTVIRRATDAGGLTDAGLHSVAAFANDSLDALIESGRLVVADYRQALADLENGTFPDGPKFAYKPVAWFAVPAGSDTLVPLAILPADGSDVIYAPPEGIAPWPWRAAKSIVASADTNHHELIAHLGRTHLFVEPFAVATHMKLSREHPVHLLLVPHFEGTIFINWAAVKFLIGDKGGVDQLLAGTIQSSRKVAVESITGGMTFDDAIVPRALAARGFGSDVPFIFPYRDDALAVWGAIHDWVASYLALFYANDAAVQNDARLQEWGDLVRSNDGGRVPSFPPLQSIADLVDALSAIIFTASAQHAAVNFPQATVMSYTPTMAAAGYADVPAAIASGSEAQWLNIQPPMDMAALQLRLTYALGSVYHTALGGYLASWFLRSGHPIEVEEALASFRHALGTIETAIIARNANLPPAFQYTYLQPSQIPQSINI